MQGASRDALAHAWTYVERQLTRAGDEHHEASAVGEELFGVVAVLDEQVGLRRALSDPSVDGKRKAALAKAVLGSHVSDITLRIVTEVVGARWSRMRDLADAIETLAVLPFDATPLLDLFEKTDSEGLRWAIANTIEIAAPPNALDWVLAAVENPVYCKSREMLVAAIGKLAPPPVATTVLKRMFEAFPLHAAMGFSAYGGEAELAFLESVDVGDRHVAREVRKAISKIKKRLARKSK